MLNILLTRLQINLWFLLYVTLSSQLANDSRRVIIIVYPTTTNIIYVLVPQTITVLAFCKIYVTIITDYLIIIIIYNFITKTNIYIYIYILTTYYCLYNDHAFSKSQKYFIITYIVKCNQTYNFDFNLTCCL